MKDTCVNQKHIKYVDYLKICGLVGLTLAHVSPPDLIMQIRSFDVPLMVFLSGMLSVSSFTKSSSNPLVYIWKRVCRLAIPTWIFVTFYFIVFSIAGGSFDTATIIKTYMFQYDSIGYVWVILVYIMCACMVPALSRIDISNIRIKVGMVILYLLYELMYYFDVGTNIRFVYCTFYYAIPYGLVTFLGMQYSKIPNGSRKIIVIINALIYISLAILFSPLGFGNRFHFTGEFKYPPRIYYLSFALAVVFVLIYMFQKLDNKLPNNKIIRFIGTSTLWIYLWHILFIEITGEYIYIDNWIIRYLTVMACSILVVYFQNLILELLKRHNIDNSITRIFRG